MGKVLIIRNANFSASSLARVDFGAAYINANPSSASFGTVQVGQSSAIQIALDGANIGQITASLSGSGFTINSTTFNVGGTLIVTFTPTASSSYSGSITLSAAGAQSVIILLSGTGTNEIEHSLTQGGLNLVYNNTNFGKKVNSSAAAYQYRIGSASDSCILVPNGKTITFSRTAGMYMDLVFYSDNSDCGHENDTTDNSVVTTYSKSVGLSTYFNLKSDASVDTASWTNNSGTDYYIRVCACAHKTSGNTQISPATILCQLE